MPMRAAIYTRNEFNEKGEVVADVAKQEESCRRYAQKQGYLITQVYQEPNLGQDEERTQLRSLRRAIWTRNIDVLLATKPDRLYYDTNRLARFAKEADLMSVRLEFVEAPLDDEYWLRESW
ncbi:MAG TPA: recombinase family protein [Nitrolancea sp.]|jgi:DNA invertase Pin-like site-specific DNA recombinase|nr:recombinase family protein [Nitrolancea sp.]